jgi:hypothetical protein
MCCTGLQFFFTRQCIKNTPEGVVRMCCTGVLFFYQAVQGTHTASKHTRGCCKNVLHRSAASLPGSARNTHGITVKTRQRVL